MTEPAPLTPGQTLRAFLRKHVAADGALDALDALHALEGGANQARREEALSAALVRAQAEARPMYKDTAIKMSGNAPDVKVASTEQALTVAREVLGKNGLMVSCTEGTKSERQGCLFLVVEFEVRHEFGGTLRARYEWPVDYTRGGWGGAGNVERGARTSALGYYVRDLLMLPRLKDEEEDAQAKRRASGPVKREAARPAERPKLGEKAQAIVDAIREAKDLSIVERSEMRVFDLRATLGGEHATYTEAEVQAMEAACRERRAALGGLPA